MMQTINIHEAKTHLSRLVEEASQGKSFIIAKAGKPLVKVSPLSEEEQKGEQNLGFMKGELLVPDDFDSMGESEIISLFDGKLS
jgi:prevent-host-death family protein